MDNWNNNVNDLNILYVRFKHSWIKGLGINKRNQEAEIAFIEFNWNLSKVRNSKKTTEC